MSASRSVLDVAAIAVFASAAQSKHDRVRTLGLTCEVLREDVRWKTSPIASPALMSDLVAALSLIIQSYRKELSIPRQSGVVASGGQADSGHIPLRATGIELELALRCLRLLVVRATHAVLLRDLRMFVSVMQL